MISRADYVNGKATHAEYYRQFLSPGLIAAVVSRIGAEKKKNPGFDRPPYEWHPIEKMGWPPTTSHSVLWKCYPESRCRGCVSVRLCLRCQTGRSGLERGAMIMPINTAAALQAFQSAGIKLEDNFHALSSSQVCVIVDCAKRDGYRKPKNANGSTARYYFAALRRKAWETIMELQKAKSLRIGQSVRCPADRGDPAYVGTVAHVEQQECTHPCVAGPFVWVTVRHQNGKQSAVWSSNRLG
jgi:hypothetical protein